MGFHVGVWSRFVGSLVFGHGERSPKRPAAIIAQVVLFLPDTTSMKRQQMLHFRGY